MQLGSLRRDSDKDAQVSALVLLTEDDLSQHAGAWLLGNHKLEASLGYVARPHERWEGGREEGLKSPDYGRTKEKAILKIRATCL